MKAKRGFIVLLASMVAVVFLVSGATGCVPTAKPPKPEVGYAKLGLIHALSGPASCWGIPCARGAAVWADDVNARGGVQVGGTTYYVDLKFYDDKGFIPAENLKAVRKGVLEDERDYFLTTSTVPVCEAIDPFLAEHGKVHLTWGAGWVIKPEWTHHIAACTQYPQLDVIGIDYIGERYPGEIQRVAIMAPDAPFGVDAKLWEEIACEAEGWDIVYSELVPMEAIDWYPMVSSILATEPDLICFASMPMAAMPSILEAGMTLGYTGKWYSNNWDMWRVLEMVPAEYVEGSIGNAGEFDDPAVVGETQHRLYNEYCRRWPGEWQVGGATPPWNAFSLVLVGIELAGTTDPMTVAETLLATDPIEHPLLGECHWGGKEVYGADHFLMTPYYVGEIRNGKLELVGVPSVADWWANPAYKEVALRHLEEAGLLYWQR